MIKSTFKFPLLGLMALALAALPLSAAEKTEKSADKAKKETPERSMSKAEKSGQPVPFRGTLTAKTDASITVKERTFEVTSETKITKDGKPATMADGEIGKEVAGRYLNHEGKLTAKSIRFGAKPEAPEKEKVAKPEKAKKGKAAAEVKPEATPEAPVK
jgi:hypothetical protein